ncbi:hypothetical protein DLM85_01000 [Hymenobacter edaphi]|uniref:Uncharacterized protein n=1 Tax=Hymenobacter edaphi TaxID=2211146 RepID=A0A328BTU9_9BACT|nr:hypothetical protein DLM85_01000 [Hymenobacter edaphi]
MILQVKLLGLVLVLLAVAHAGFPRYFNWAGELRAVSLINRQMMYIHTLFIALAVLLMGLLCLLCAPELVATALGRKVCLGLGLFWLARLLVQFVGYSPALWRGQRFETAVHVGFALLWTYLTAVFFVVAWGRA